MPATIHFPIPPTPSNAPVYAEEAVAAAMEIDRIDLDYSAESLEAVDRTLGEFRLAGVPFEVTSGATLALGCYVGEVVVRCLGGRWAKPARGRRPGGSEVPLIVILRGGSACDPIGEAFSRVHGPAETNVVDFFRRLSAAQMGPT